jgi:hypothetical protein
VNALLYFVAGVDRDQIEQCPRTDQILARQLGVMLTLTFAIVAAITFYSISYIGSSSAQYDVISGSFQAAKAALSAQAYFLIAIASCVVALMITLFDRMLYQSDWFYQLPISDVETNERYARPKFFLRKAWRVVVRLAISLAVAYSLSTFLELKVFESQIVKKNQDIYIARNEPIFSDIKQEAARLSSRISGASNEISVLRQAAIEQQTAESVVDAGLAAKLRAIDAELADMDGAVARQHQALIDRTENELAPLLNENRDLLSRLEEATKSVAQYTDYVNAERGGVNPEGLPGVSEKAGCAARCKYWEAKLDQATVDEGRLQSLIDKSNSAIEAIRRAHIVAASQIDDESTERKGILLSVRDDALARVEAESAKMLAQHRLRTREIADSLQEKERALSLLEGSYVKDLADFEDRRRASPDYVPFSDGPLERLTALLELKRDTQYGKTITWFSWWVKGFVIFLELAPVLAKLFFAPPSVYGFRVRAKVAAGQIEQIDIANNRATASREEYEAGIAKLDEMARARQSRSVVRKAMEDAEAEYFAAKKRAV